MQAIVDMPDRLIDLFIRLCVQNRGQLSATKRDRHFESLNDEEIAAMEAAIRKAYGLDGMSRHTERANS